MFFLTWPQFQRATYLLFVILFTIRLNITLDLHGRCSEEAAFHLTINGFLIFHWSGLFFSMPWSLGLVISCCDTFSFSPFHSSSLLYVAIKTNISIITAYFSGRRCYSVFSLIIFPFLEFSWQSHLGSAVLASLLHWPLSPVYTIVVCTNKPLFLSFVLFPINHAVIYTYIFVRSNHFYRHTRLSNNLPSFFTVSLEHKTLPSLFEKNYGCLPSL